MGGDKPNTSLWVQAPSERVNVKPRNTNSASRHRVSMDMAFLEASFEDKTSSEPTSVSHRLRYRGKVLRHAKLSEEAF